MTLDRFTCPASRFDVAAPRFDAKASFNEAFTSIDGNGRPRLGHALRAIDLQLVFQMDVGGRQERMNPGTLGPAQGLAGTLDVFLLATRQCSNSRAANLARDELHGGKIPVRRNRETGLEDVDTQRIQRLRHAQFF